MTGWRPPTGGARHTAMARDSRALERMTRRELLDEVKRLRSSPTERHNLGRVVFDLRTYQEELAT